MKRIASRLSHRLAGYLNQPIKRYEPFAISDPQRLAAALIPGDVLLVEGNRRISTAIKYLTQSTWSHAALYVGDFGGTGAGVDAPTLIEADVERGVIAVQLTSVAGVNTRVCRPVGLESADRQRVCQYAIERLGLTYDLKNIIDLARYLLPVPPVPVCWRRRMLALGSGDPTRAICSTLIARAFQSVRYPILPRIERGALSGPDAREYGRTRDPSHSPLRLVHAARFRHLAVLSHHQAGDRRGFQLSHVAVGGWAQHHRSAWMTDPQLALCNSPVVSPVY
jgi:Permuted papain-like amidase enzyme, YaeF/YiiX, C92 family